MTRAHVYTLALLVLSELAFGQSEGKLLSAKDVVKWNVRVDVQMLAVRNEDAPRMIRRLQDHRQSETAAAELQKMLVRGSAELIGWPMAWMADGSRASAETLQEIRFVTHDDRGAGGWLSPFETRNAGATLQVEATVDPDGLNVHLNFVPERIELARFRTHRLGRTPGGLEMFVEQPQFNSGRVTTGLTTRSGQPQLVGVFYGAKPNDKVILFILRATIMSVDREPFAK